MDTFFGKIILREETQSVGKHLLDQIN